MTFNQFKDWCNDRACDGCWGRKEALLCLHIAFTIDAYPFWKKEKIWKREYRDLIVSAIVEPINNKIKEMLAEEPHE